MTNGARVYFDSCCFIDMAQVKLELGLESDRENHAFFCKQLLDASRAGEAEVITSILTLSECVALKDFSKKASDVSPKIATGEIRRLFEMMILSGKSGVRLYQQTPATTRKARDLSFDEGLQLGAMDRMHIATALMNECSHLITTDKFGGGEKGLANIKIINDLGLAVCSADKVAHLLPDKYKQLPLRKSHGQQKKVA